MLSGSDIEEQLFIAFIINSYHPGKKILAGFIATKPPSALTPSCKMFVKEGRLSCHKGEGDKALCQREMPRSLSLCLRILSNENPLTKHQRFCCCHNTRKSSYNVTAKVGF